MTFRSDHRLPFARHTTMFTLVIVSRRSSCNCGINNFNIIIILIVVINTLMVLDNLELWLFKTILNIFSCSDLTRSGAVSLTVPAQLALKHDWHWHIHHSLDCSLGECWTLWPFLAFFLRTRLRFLSFVAGFFACGLPLFSEAGGMP